MDATAILILIILDLVMKLQTGSPCSHFFKKTHPRIFLFLLAHVATLFRLFSRYKSPASSWLSSVAGWLPQTVSFLFPNFFLFRRAKFRSLFLMCVTSPTEFPIRRPMPTETDKNHVEHLLRNYELSKRSKKYQSELKYVVLNMSLEAC